MLLLFFLNSRVWCSWLGRGLHTHEDQGSIPRFFNFFVSPGFLLDWFIGIGVTRATLAFSPLLTGPSSSSDGYFQGTAHNCEHPYVKCQKNSNSVCVWRGTRTRDTCNKSSALPTELSPLSLGIGSPLIGASCVRIMPTRWVYDDKTEIDSDGVVYCQIQSKADRDGNLSEARCRF